MPEKDKKNKITGHVLFLKEAWKEKEKIITGLYYFEKKPEKKIAGHLFFLKEAWKKRKEKETGHFMSILYSIMTCVAVCSKV